MKVLLLFFLVSVFGAEEILGLDSSFSRFLDENPVQDPLSAVAERQLHKIKRKKKSSRAKKIHNKKKQKKDGGLSQDTVNLIVSKVGDLIVNSLSKRKIAE